jgi:hypothetical protein
MAKEASNDSIRANGISQKFMGLPGHSQNHYQVRGLGHGGASTSLKVGE